MVATTFKTVFHFLFLKRALHQALDGGVTSSSSWSLTLHQMCFSLRGGVMRSMDQTCKNRSLSRVKLAHSPSGWTAATTCKISFLHNWSSALQIKPSLSSPWSLRILWKASCCQTRLSACCPALRFSMDADDGGIPVRFTSKHFCSSGVICLYRSLAFSWTTFTFSWTHPTTKEKLLNPKITKVSEAFLLSELKKNYLRRALYTWRNLCGDETSSTPVMLQCKQASARSGSLFCRQYSSYFVLKAPVFPSLVGNHFSEDALSGSTRKERSKLDPDTNRLTPTMGLILSSMDSILSPWEERMLGKKCTNKIVMKLSKR